MSWLQPQHDDLTGDFYAGGAQGLLQQTLMGQSQFFNFEGFFLPSTIKELFKYSAYMVLTSSSINPVIEKMAEYPITDFIFQPEPDEELDEKEHQEFLEANKSLIRKWEEIALELKFKEFAMKLAMNYQTYGNSFAGVYQPFDRHLVCRACGVEERAKNAKWDWDRGSLQFILHCRACGKKKAADINDVMVKDWRRANLISYYPGHFDIDYDPYSGVTEYYYTVQDDELQKIKQGDRLRLINTPMDVIDAARMSRSGRSKSPRVRFYKNNVYHLARASFDLPGTETPWGIPNTISVLRDMFYMNMMKRAQLALLLEHIIPLQIIFPAVDVGVNTTVPINLNDWRKTYGKELIKWKRDPLYKILSPIPLGCTQIGGQGKALMLYPEMEQTENAIVNGLNAPLEFVRGGLTYSGSNVSLRMLENSLFNQVSGIVRIFQWIANTIADMCGLKRVKVSMKKFKMTDDIQAKQLQLTLWQLGLISGKTLAQTNDLDYDYEIETRTAENLSRAITDAKAQAEAASNLQALQSILMNAMPPQTTLSEPTIPSAQVDQLFQIFQGMPPNKAKKNMEDLAMQNPELARALQTRMDSDPGIMAGQAQQLAAMPDDQRNIALQEITQNNPVMGALMENMMAHFGKATLQGAGTPGRGAPGKPAQGGKIDKNMPNQKPPVRKGGSAM